MKRDLTTDLLKPEYDQDEFHCVLSDVLNMCHGSVECEVFGDRLSPSSTVNWNRDGSIGQLLAGPGLTPTLLANLRKQIVDALDTTAEAFRKYVVLTRRPVVGSMRVEDWFQLVEAPPEAPRPKQFYAGGNPAILEIKLKWSASTSVTGLRAFRGAREVGLLLSGLLRDDIAQPLPPSQHVWVADPENPGRVLHTQTHYTIEGFSPLIDGFSSDTRLATIARCDPTVYYTRIGTGFNEPLDVPATFADVAVKFRRLPASSRQKFLRGAYWLQTSGLMWQLSPSAGFAALVRGVETLMPAVRAGPPCGTCGVSAGPGIRATFADFVDRLSGGAIPRPMRLAFYDLRSRLVHGEALLTADQGVWSFAGPEYLTEMRDRRVLEQVSRIVFHNWLIEEERATSE